MSFNIRYDNHHDGEFAWKHRKTEMTDFLSYYAPHILATQEALHSQVIYLDRNLTQYKNVGVGRNDGKTKGEFCAIFYDTTEISLIKQQTFWLSKTPEKVSIGLDAAMERIFTFAKFKHKSSIKQFWIFNTH
ncbi:MAG: hypothetical protein PF448_09710 [Bacteroidales bacterium]|jgi:endonuclease/exonuclease/phosphatase family metal-dependent hydrolase|nr:hypothetical protein [Bacteroidales bacterium]